MVAARIKSDFYVDNLLTSFDTVDDGASVYNALVKLFGTGGFPLVQFASSARHLLEKVPVDIRATPELDLDLDRLPIERTLGYLWNCQHDTLVFQFKELEAADTKRAILAAVSSIFDPVGLLSPVVLVAKILLQDIWRLKADWDSPLTSDTLARWRRWTAGLPVLESLSIRRSFLVRPDSNYRSLQLHAFSDASKDGFGAAIYLRSQDENVVDFALVMAKARVAPIHQLTIPKLELQGALMGSRLIEYCRREMTLDVAAVYFWCDATTVLRWLHSSHHRYTPFVANRVSEILEKSKAEQWRHVPGILNPADDCSRGLGPEHFEANHRWFSGPEFLKLPETSWPVPFSNEATPETPEEWTGCLAVNVEGPIDKLTSRLSNFHRLVRIAAWVNRFVLNVRVAMMRNRQLVAVTGSKTHPVNGPKSERKTGRWQSADEFKSARMMLLRAAQRASFPDEVNLLKRGKPIRRESRLLQDTPFMDGNGLLCVGGRLLNAQLNDDTRHPIILEPNHALTRLLVRLAHFAVAHDAVDRTLAEMRARYWVLRSAAPRNPSSHAASTVQSDEQNRLSRRWRRCQNSESNRSNHRSTASE